MLYIHRLMDLNPKSAEIETTPILRRLRERCRFPLTEQQLAEDFPEYFVSETDQKLIMQAIELLPDVMRRVSSFSETYAEPRNIQRAHSLLQEIQEPLQKSKAYVDDLRAWHNGCLPALVTLLNSIRQLRTQEEKVRVNDELNMIFVRLLGTDRFVFSHPVVNEGHVIRTNDLAESMGKGVLFRVTLEEEIKKMPWDQIQLRIPKEHLQEAEELRQRILQIKKGIDCAYNCNMRTIALSILLYTYVKWVKTG